jgi:ElaB/YqjD/DUF883 family membrane-anchored ribosome-binding protein
VTNRTHAADQTSYPLDYSDPRPKPGQSTQGSEQQLKALAEQAEDIARRLADQAQHAAERVQEFATNIRPTLEKSAKEQPMATLAGMALVGFVLGALWKK